MARKKTQKEPANPRPAKKKSGKKGGLWTIMSIAALTVVAGIVVLAYFGKDVIKPITERKTRAVTVYFSSEDGLYLKGEKAKIKKGGLEAEAKEVVESLIKGPKNTALGATLPPGTRLISLRIKDGLATTDFSPEIIKNHPGGSSGEIQTVYSIVNTLTLNFGDVKKVQLLVNGKKEETIAGHIDITFPLGPDMKIINE